VTANSLAEHLVIGGGPAGSTLAIRLAAAGRRVMLIEKEREAHHKVCGEFLSREAIHYLHQVAVDPPSCGAQVIDTVRLSCGNKLVAAPLPFPALSLSRHVLDQALLARAADCGCRIIRGVAVESLTATGSVDGQVWLAQLSNGDSVRTPAVFLATGKHDLRGWARPAGRQNDLIGFKLHWQLAPAQVQTLRNHMDLYLFPGGYGGLCLVESDIANFCLVVQRSTLRAHGAWPHLLAAILAQNAHLRRLLSGAQPLWPRPIAVSPIPYGYLAPDERALWRIGDQAAVIPSFTGDGISIALHSAALAAEMFLAGHDASAFHRALHAQLRGSMAIATFLSSSAVTASGRAAALLGVLAFPGIMRYIAASTRIPERALLGPRDPHATPRTPPGGLSPTPQAQ
jgi:menaquinone-9 beta-reductase